ncbi:cell division protein FtsK [Sutcliffiella horikoshii]|uniref:cell division protein FtsK n=1 Tax=Sutcliffiella horikoshii TaxID=79883 RepID=UPI00203FC2ED|nr:cell division protein FtsK [Sutcliffiella horikoshii]MCM3619905.1 cell division protein FtsK [Sutcliffiella horikoshii]
MSIFQKISKFLYMSELKQKLYFEGNNEMTREEKDYINQIKRQNPFGLIVFLLGGASFAFGPRFILLPLLTIILFFLTFGTFDKEKEDNPWTFYIGLGLSVIGLYMNLYELLHEDYLYY